MSSKLPLRVDGDQSPRMDGNPHGNPLFDFDPGPHVLNANEALLLSPLVSHFPPEQDVTGKKKPHYKSKRPIPKLSSLSPLPSQSTLSPRGFSKRHPNHSSSLLDFFLRPRNVFIAMILLLVLLQTSYHLQLHRQLSKLLSRSLSNPRPAPIQEVENVPTPTLTPTPAKFVRYPKLKRKYIFCINPGRSGSQYLAALLREAGIRSKHEPDPKVNGYFLQVALQSGLEGTEELRLSDKALALFEVWKDEEYLNDLSSDERKFQRDIYAETSNMFIKTWPDIINFIPKYPGDWEFRIVILRRYLPLVVKSQYELGWFHPDHAQRGVWYYGLNDVDPKLQRLPPLKPDNELTRWEQIIGYNLDIEILAQQFLEKYQRRPHVFIFEVRLEDLVATPEIATSVLSFVSPGSHVRALPKVINDRTKAKKFNTTLEEATEQVFSFINAYRRKGIKLPVIPHLQEWDLTDPFRNVKRN